MKVKFPRSTNPREGRLKEPTLIVFGKGLHETCYSRVFLRWKREDSHMECRLVTGKTQEAPFSEDNHQRDRTGYAIELGRLAKWVWESLNMPIRKVRYLTDPSAVLGILKMEQRDLMSSWGQGFAR
jgi:hypothetical protein